MFYARSRAYEDDLLKSRIFCDKYNKNIYMTMEPNSLSAQKLTIIYLDGLIKSKNFKIHLSNVCMFF